jgi:CRISPR-associated protein (TIGR02710 family)
MGVVGDRDDVFVQHVRQMRRITDGEESFGSGGSYEQATRYYLKYLVDECAERARSASRGLPPKVDLLISVTGHSPRITVLAYKILRPSRLVVVPSDDARDSYNTIHRYVSANGLQPADISQRPCDPTDPLSIYRIVKDELDSHTRSRGTDGIAYIDITGGRKVMSATAALAAWQLDLGLCYIDGDYDAELGQAIPGSDRLLLLDNPTSLFGEQEMKAAEHAFDGGAFDAARRRFEELAGRLAQPGRARFMAALSALYQVWCDINWKALPAAIVRVEETLQPIQRTLPKGTVATVDAQLRYLRALARRDRRSLLLCFNLLDDHYRRVGRHDFATLFSYRTIEGCLVGQLASRYRGFDCESPDWQLLAADTRSLRSAYSDVVNAVDGQQKRRSLPSPVGVFQGAVLLRVMSDPFAATAQLGDVESLRELRELANARNRSVLAHGEEAVDVQVSQRLNVKASKVLQAYWELHHPDEDILELRKELTFMQARGM